VGGGGRGVYFNEKICTVHNSHNENIENGKYSKKKLLPAISLILAGG